MSKVGHEQIHGPQQGVKMSLDLGIYHEMLQARSKGEVFLELTDSVTGKVLEYREMQNIITLDSGILAARLFANALNPNPAQNNGITMLGVGTGATGNLLSPDAPTASQRRLNAEVWRKACTPQFRNSSGIAVALTTNVVDFTTTFGNGEAVGALNEMGLMSTIALTAGAIAYPGNRIINGTGSVTPTYDATIDVTAKDLMSNYLTFGTISKPNLAVLRLTWRYTF